MGVDWVWLLLVSHVILCGQVSSLANPYGVCVAMLYGCYLMSVDMV